MDTGSNDSEEHLIEFVDTDTNTTPIAPTRPSNKHPQTSKYLGPTEEDDDDDEDDDEDDDDDDDDDDGSQATNNRSRHAGKGIGKGKFLGKGVSHLSSARSTPSQLSSPSLSSISSSAADSSNVVVNDAYGSQLRPGGLRPAGKGQVRVAGKGKGFSAGMTIASHTYNNNNDDEDDDDDDDEEEEEDDDNDASQRNRGRQMHPAGKVTRRLRDQQSVASTVDSGTNTTATAPYIPATPQTPVTGTRVDPNLRKVGLPCVVLEVLGKRYSVFNTSRSEENKDGFFINGYPNTSAGEPEKLFCVPLRKFMSIIREMFCLENRDVQIEFPQLDLIVDETMSVSSTLTFADVYRFLLAHQFDNAPQDGEMPDLHGTVTLKPVNLEQQLNSLDSILADSDARFYRFGTESLTYSSALPINMRSRSSKSVGENRRKRQHEHDGDDYEDDDDNQYDWNNGTGDEGLAYSSQPRKMMRGSSNKDDLPTGRLSVRDGRLSKKKRIHIMGGNEDSDEDDDEEEDIFVSDEEAEDEPEEEDDDEEEEEEDDNGSSTMLDSLTAGSAALNPGFAGTTTTQSIGVSNGQMLASIDNLNSGLMSTFSPMNGSIAQQPGTTGPLDFGQSHMSLLGVDVPGTMTSTLPEGLLSGNGLDLQYSDAFGSIMRMTTQPPIGDVMAGNSPNIPAKQEGSIGDLQPNVNASSTDTPSTIAGRPQGLTLQVGTKLDKTDDTDKINSATIKSLMTDFLVDD